MIEMQIQYCSKNVFQKWSYDILKKEDKLLTVHYLFSSCVGLSLEQFCCNLLF